MDSHILKLKPEISVGEAQVIDSGCLLITETDVPIFKIPVQGGTFFTFKFRFVKDENLKDENGVVKSSFDYNVKDENGEDFLDVVFTNMDDVTFAGNIQKAKFATISGHPITFKFRLSSVGQNPINYVFNYTWFLEPKSNNITMS